MYEQARAEATAWARYASRPRVKDTAASAHSRSGQRAGLAPDSRAHTQLADVVDKCRAAKELAIADCQSGMSGSVCGRISNIARVVEEPLRLDVTEVGDDLEGCIEFVLVLPSRLFEQSSLELLDGHFRTTPYLSLYHLACTQTVWPVTTLQRWIGRCLQAELIADEIQRLMPCGLEGPVACG